MSRTRITTDDATGRVTITYTDWLGERCTRTFSTTRREERSYVIEFLADGRTTQPCDRLARTGSTLMATRDGLADVIRREYRAMRRAERAERAL